MLSSKSSHVVFQARKRHKKNKIVEEKIVLNKKKMKKWILNGNNEIVE